MTNTAFDEQRRKFISTSMVVSLGAVVAGSGFLGSAQAQAAAGSKNAGGQASSAQTAPGESSASWKPQYRPRRPEHGARTYQTTVPARPEMIDIIRTAYERGVT